MNTRKVLARPIAEPITEHELRGLLLDLEMQSRRARNEHKASCNVCNCY